MKNQLLYILIPILFFSCQDKKLSADLIITNAAIWTGNSTMPKADAIAIKADTIIAIGLEKDINILSPFRFSGHEDFTN